MEPVILDHVRAFTDGLSGGEDELAHAREWASSLRLPLQVLSVTDASASRSNGTCNSESGDQLTAAQIPRDNSGKTLHAQESSTLTDQLFHPHGLSVFNSALPAEFNRRLVSASLHATESAILICSRSCRSISRALILHALQEDEIGFLHSALSLCRLFEVTPVILTLARNETKARHWQRMAEEACFSHRIPALFDYVVGLDVRAAVLSIARWRHCSHVFMPRRQSIPWWRWPRRDILKLLVESDNSLSFLALPELGIQTPDSAFQGHSGAEFLHPN